MVTLVKGLQDPVDPGQLFFRSAVPFGCFLGIAFFWLHLARRGLAGKISRQAVKTPRRKREWGPRMDANRISNKDAKTKTEPFIAAKRRKRLKKNREWTRMKDEPQPRNRLG